MNIYQAKRNSIIQQESHRTQNNYPLETQNKKDVIITNDRHSGCIERIQILTQELDRMSEALRETNQQVLYLQQEIQKLRVIQPSSNDDLIQKIQFERQKLDQFQQKKEEQLNEMENKLNRLHKDLQDERIQKLDYVNRYQQQLEEVVRLQKNLEKSKYLPNDLETSSQQKNQFHLQIEDLQNENQDLKSKINTFQNTILQQKQKIALLEDQLTQQQSYQPFSQGPPFYQLPQIQYQQSKPQTSSYQKVKTYQIESKETNKATEVKTQVIQTLNGKTDVYEYSSIQDPNNPRKSLASRLDQINIQPFSNFETRNSKLQNNISQSSFQKGQTYISDQYKKDFNDLKNQAQIENKPVTEYKTTVSTSNKYSNY